MDCNECINCKKRVEDEEYFAQCTPTAEEIAEAQKEWTYQAGRGM